MRPISAETAEIGQKLIKYGSRTEPNYRLFQNHADPSKNRALFRPSLIKRGNFGNCEAEVKRKAEDFQAAVEPVLKIRHEQIAHMKPGTISSYPLNPLPSEALTALERIIRLVDQARSKAVQYFAKVGSQEAAIDLRLSLQKGARN